MTPAAPIAPLRCPHPPRQPRHLWELALAASLALAAHAWLLMPAPSIKRPALAAVPTQLVQVSLRHTNLVAPAPAPNSTTGEQTGPGPGTRGAPVGTQAHAHAAAASEAASPAGAVTGPTPDPDRADPVDAAHGDTPPLLPTYTTQLPPAATVHYEMRRKAVSGKATLQWQPTDTGYRISLQGQLAGLPVVEGASQGEFDSAGIAPLRYSESRRGRELRAANFQRAAGRITYSGPTVEHAIVPGAQDRLSWLVQLGSVLAANPGLAQEGAQVAMWVVGSRGDALAWTFEVQGMESVTLPDGSVVQALHLHRAPQRPYDTHADVWLAPAHHHLPVRLHLQVRATGEGTDYLLHRLELH